MPTCQTSKMENFTRIVNNFEALLFQSKTLLNVWQGSEYVSDDSSNILGTNLYSPDFACNLWFSDDFRENRSSLIRLNLPNIPPSTQDVKWTYIKRSEDVQDNFWAFYVRSIYILCLVGRSEIWKRYLRT